MKILYQIFLLSSLSKSVHLLLKVSQSLNYPLRLIQKLTKITKILIYLYLSIADNFFILKLFLSLLTLLMKKCLVIFYPNKLSKSTYGQTTFFSNNRQVVYKLYSQVYVNDSLFSTQFFLSIINGTFYIHTSQPKSNF